MKPEVFRRRAVAYRMREREASNPTPVPVEAPRFKQQPAVSPDDPRLADLQRFHKTDLGNSELLATWHGDELRYCPAWNKWMAWDGQRWKIDDTGAVYRKAAEIVRERYALAGKIDDQDERKRVATHAFKCESKARLDAMVALAATNAALVIQPDALDTDGMLLNTGNGTLDLRTGELQKHRREDLITKLVPTAYDRGANCSQWLRFLSKIFERDQELINFVQRAIGYSFSASVSEQCLFMLHGDGQNGKSTLIEAVLHLLGDYSLMSPSDTLLAKRNDGIPNDIARLQGRRFVAAIETDENRRLAESRIKGLTGGDTITARFMRGEWFDFQPEFKLWLATNHLPRVRGSDLAMWRRIRLIPFHYTFSEKETDPDFLKSLIATELPGILRWSVMGCLDWRKNRLKPPEQVTAATDEYRASENQVARFIDESDIGSDGEVRLRDAYHEYRTWTGETGEHQLTEKAFAQRLLRCGFTKHKRKAGMFYGRVSPKNG